MDEMYKSLASNGPWALVALFLLNQVIRAWTNDRSQLTVLLGDFKSALYSLTSAVEGLRSEIKGKE